MNGLEKIDWAALAGEAAGLVRPETRAKYFPKNPLRRMIINRFLERVAHELSWPWMTLLDVGCGEGFVDYFLAGRFAGRTITGAEPDAGALRVARAVNPGADYVEAEGRGLPFQDDSFDVVICLEVLEHLRDHRAVMREIKRVSRGPCLFSVPAWPYYQAMNFMIGKNWARLGEHPDHVIRFSKKIFIGELMQVFGPETRVTLSAPWLIGACGFPAQ